MVQTNQCVKLYVSLPCNNLGFRKCISLFNSCFDRTKLKSVKQVYFETKHYEYLLKGCVLNMTILFNLPISHGCVKAGNIKAIVVIIWISRCFSY